MKKYFEEIVIIIIQMLVFYVLPIFTVESAPSGIVIIVLLATFMLSLVFGGISKKKIKDYYPVIVLGIFLSAMLIHNTAFLLIHALWFFMASLIGVMIGNIIMNK